MLQIVWREINPGLAFSVNRVVQSVVDCVIGHFVPAG